MHAFRTEGIVIKRRNLGEADRILTVFTKNKGKISVIAKGVRRINSKRSPHIELLNHCVIGIYEGKAYTLMEAETINHYVGLKNDLEKAGYAFYVCEIADGLLPEHQENKAAFGLILSVLAKLETADNCSLVISKFEQDLLSVLGYWPKERLMIEDSDTFIEDIIERRIKSKKILQLF